MFADTGVPHLFLECYKLRAQKSRVILKVGWGASSKANPDDDYFEIGKRNFIMLRRLLWKNGVLIKALDVGGSESRTMSLAVVTGDVTLKINGTTSTM